MSALSCFNYLNTGQFSAVFVLVSGILCVTSQFSFLAGVCVEGAENPENRFKCGKEMLQKLASGGEHLIDKTSDCRVLSWW